MPLNYDFDIIVGAVGGDAAIAGFRDIRTVEALIGAPEPVRDRLEACGILPRIARSSLAPGTYAEEDEADRAEVLARLVDSIKAEGWPEGSENSSGFNLHAFLETALMAEPVATGASAAMSAGAGAAAPSDTPQAGPRGRSQASPQGATRTPAPAPAEALARNGAPDAFLAPQAPPEPAPPSMMPPPEPMQMRPSHPAYPGADAMLADGAAALPEGAPGSLVDEDDDSYSRRRRGRTKKKKEKKKVPAIVTIAVALTIYGMIYFTQLWLSSP